MFVVILVSVLYFFSHCRLSTDRDQLLARADSLSGYPVRVTLPSGHHHQPPSYEEATGGALLAPLTPGDTREAQQAPQYSILGDTRGVTPTPEYSISDHTRGVIPIPQYSCPDDTRGASQAPHYSTAGTRQAPLQSGCNQEAEGGAPSGTSLPKHNAGTSPALQLPQYSETSEPQPSHVSQVSRRF